MKRKSENLVVAYPTKLVSQLVFCIILNPKIIGSSTSENGEAWKEKNLSYSCSYIGFQQVWPLLQACVHLSQNID